MTTRFLIVDDAPDVRRMLGDWLRARSFTVTEAASAGEALDQMAEHAPAIALCDAALPDRNGLWLAGQMRRQFPDTAILISTGSGLPSLPPTLEADAVGYLPKPCTEDELLRTVDWALEWRRANGG